MLHGSEHVLIRPVISNTQHKVWCIALISQLLQDAVHSVALGCALHTPTDAFTHQHSLDTVDQGQGMLVKGCRDLVEAIEAPIWVNGMWKSLESLVYCVSQAPVNQAHDGVCAV